MNNNYIYGTTASPEKLSKFAPIMFRGDIYDSIAKAQKIGYQALELHLKNPTEFDQEGLKEYCTQRNFKICALATGMEFSINGLSLISDDKKIRQASIVRLKEYIDFAEKFGSVVIVGCMRGNIPDFDNYGLFERRLVEGITQLVEYSTNRGVVLVLEAINSYINNYLNTVQETTDFVNRIGSPFLKVHIDTHHMNIEDADMVESIRYSNKNIGYVHISDSNRMYPGGGHIDFRKIMAALQEVDYRGCVTLECIPGQNGYDAAEIGLKYMKNLA